MNKIIIITDFRPPKEGEHFIAFSAKKVELAESDRASAGDSRFIVGAEIEVPENADHLHVHFDKKHEREIYAAPAIPLHRKPKVRKYQFVHLNTDHCNRKRAEVTGWMTEAEAVDRLRTQWYYRVEGSEIEVEE